MSTMLVLILVDLCGRVVAGLPVGGGVAEGDGDEHARQRVARDGWWRVVAAGGAGARVGARDDAESSARVTPA